MNWRVDILNRTVAEEFDSLPPDMRAKLDHIIRLIEEFGLHRVREPYVKPLRDKLWEMRMKGRDGIARAIYVSAKDRRIVIVRLPQEDPEDPAGGDPHGLVQSAGVEAMTIPYGDLRKQWKEDPEFRKEFDVLEPEFRLARALIEARARAGMSQSEVAVRMGTSQPTVARLESGHKPSLKTLERYAEAVGMKVEIRLVAG